MRDFGVRLLGFTVFFFPQIRGGLGALQGIFRGYIEVSRGVLQGLGFRALGMLLESNGKQHGNGKEAEMH